MNFLHMTHRYLPVIGGSEQYIHQIASRQAASGHKVTVVTTNAFDFSSFWSPAGKKLPIANTIIDGVEVVRVPIQYFPASVLIFPLLRRFALFFSNFPITQKIAQICMRNTPYIPELGNTLTNLGDDWDIIFGWNITFDGIMTQAYRQAKTSNAKFVAIPFLHLGEGTRSTVRQYYTMPHQLQILKNADKVIAQTKIERDFLAHASIDLKKIIIAGAGISPEHLANGNEEAFRRKHNTTSRILTAIGPLTYSKGTIHIIRAFQQLRKKNNDVSLVLAGAPMADFEKEWGKFSVEEKEMILRLGIISDEEKKNLLAATDVLILFSRTESFGIVMLEAWLYGKPVIGAEAGAVSEIVEDSIDGYLAPFGDERKLVDTINFVLNNPQIAKEMGERGRRKVLRKYTWNAVFTRFTEGISDLSEPLIL